LRLGFFKLSGQSNNHSNISVSIRRKGGVMKSHAKLHWSRVLVAVVCLALLGLAQDKSGSVNAAAAQAEEAALRAVVEKFFAAYGKKDLAGVMALWSEKSPDLAAHQKALGQQFATEDYSFGNPMISRVKVEGGKASLRATIDMAAINQQSKQKREERWARNFSLIKEGGEWKIWRDASAMDDLAEALVKIQAEAERALLIAEERELLTAELVRALNSQGNRLAGQREYPKAEDAFHQAQSIAKQIGNDREVARTLINMGNVYFRRNDYEQAEKSFQKGLEINQQLDDKRGIAAALINIGNVRYLLGDRKQALAHYQKGLEISESLRDQIRIATALQNTGIIYAEQGDYPQALECFQKSLTIKDSLKDEAGVALTLGNLGVVYKSQGNYVQAMDCYQKSLAVRTRLGDKHGIAGMLSNIGVIHQEQGDYAQAMDCYQQSLAMEKELGDRLGAAGTLQNIGNVHSSQSNFARALEYYQKSLEIRKELKDKAGIARTLGDIGVIHLLQNDHVQALEHFLEVLALMKTLDDKTGIATTLYNMGFVYSSQNDHVQALKYYQESKEMSKAIGAQGTVALTLMGIGNAHGLRGEYEQSLKSFQGSRAIHEALGNKVGISYALNGIGTVYRKQHSYSRALEFAERSTAFAKQAGNTEGYWRARVQAGLAHQTLRQPAQARQAFEEAIAAVETMRHLVAGGEQAMQRSFEDKLTPYLAMVDLLISQSKMAEALTYAERAKSRVLLDTLYSGRVNVSKAMTSEEQNRERELNGKLVSLNTQVFREKQRQEHERDKARLAALESDLQKARLEYETFQTNLYAAHPNLKTQRGKAEVLTLEEAGSLLPDAKTALLEFVVAEDKTFLFVLTKTADVQAPVVLKVLPIAIKPKELAELTEQFRQQLAQPGSPVSKMARELFDLLFKDAHALIQGKDKLVIVPDGPLWEMPFQALLSPRDRYLVKDHAIAYAPSLTALREMIKLRQRKSSEAPTLLAIGNPALGKEVVERRSRLMGNPLEPLPDAETQVRRLSRFYDPRRSKIYIGAEATEARVKAEAGQYTVLQFATHGEPNDRSPMYSHLVLAQTGEKDQEDGLLEAWEFLNLDLKADLAVLSACETARGRVGAGEGMIGLTWALFVAGVPTTVVSQWKVRSDSTAELMVEFHRLLQAHNTKGAPRLSRAEALRQAALKLLNGNQHRHPFFWAGFVLVGDWR
jgi:CHAT domain-containing protein/Tfp pilus assembly protein PilF